MNKAKLKYVKYTKKELDKYVRDKNSCISLSTSEMHIGFPPWGFANFQETLTNIISRDKIGKYDAKFNGIILDVRNIKVFGTAYPVHDDDPVNHINIRADFYIFQPRIGVVVKGVVKHISHGHIAVIIYRVFNVSIRFNRDSVRDSLRVNQQISFRIKNFDLSGAMPYIEGEFIGVDASKMNIKTNSTLNKHSRFDDNENGGDSGISTEETVDTNTNKKKMNLKQETDTESSSDDSDTESDSGTDSESEKIARKNLVEELFKGVKVKKEELSDSEDDVPEKKSTGTKDSSEESSSDDDTSEDDSEDEHTKQSISLKNIKKENSSSSESTSRSEDSDSSDSSESPAQNGLGSIKVKEEPASDAEGGKFKKPLTTNHRRNSALVQGNGLPTRKRTSSVSERLESLMIEYKESEKSAKRQSLPAKKTKPNDESFNLNDLSTTVFQSPALSSTLKPNSRLKRNNLDLMSPSKIKQESDSDTDAKKRKHNKNSQS